jgi:hypothetical protein
MWARGAMVGRAPAPPPPSAAGAAAPLRASTVSVSDLTAVRTTLGVRHGPALCVDEAIAACDRRHPDPDAGSDCCRWGYRRTCTAAFEYNLLCLCYLGGVVALRLFLVLPVALVLGLGNMLVALLLVPGSIFHFYRSVVYRSTRVGPFAKLLFALGFPLVAVLAPLPVFVISLLYGVTVPFYASLATAGTVMCTGVGEYATRGYRERKAAYAVYESDGPYFEIRVWAPFVALLGLAVGAAVGAVAYFFIALCLAPRILWSIVHPLWTQPLPSRARARTGNARVDGDPCVMCMQCCVGSISECFWLLAIPFKFAASLVVFVLVLLYVPVALLVGLVAGAAAGATAWSAVANLWEGPASSIADFYGANIAFIKQDNGCL